MPPATKTSEIKLVIRGKQSGAKDAMTTDKLLELIRTFQATTPVPAPLRIVNMMFMDSGSIEPGWEITSGGNSTFSATTAALTVAMVNLGKHLVKYMGSGWIASTTVDESIPF